jgi:hypothetical protein
MMPLLAAISPRSRKVLGYCAWGALIILLLALSPYLLDFLSRAIDWIIGLFPHSRPLWEETSWLR